MTQLERLFQNFIDQATKLKLKDDEYVLFITGNSKQHHNAIVGDDALIVAGMLHIAGSETDFKNNIYKASGLLKEMDFKNDKTIN